MEDINQNQQQTGEVKALPSSNQPLVYTLPNAYLVNSLPYIDNHLMKQTENGPKVSKSMVKKIRKMIAHESKLLEKEGEVDYLETLEVPATPKLDSMIEEDMIDTLKNQLLGKREPKTGDKNVDDTQRFKKLVTKVQQSSNQ